MIEAEIAQLVLADLPVATAVVDISGRVAYANRAAKKAFRFSKHSEGYAGTIAEWQPQNASLSMRLRTIAASSNWVPIKLKRDRKTLHLRARGFRVCDDQVPCVLITSAQDVAAPFKDHARQITRLNQQLAIYQRTEVQLRNSMEVSELLKHELIHRVKNNLAVMSALLRSEARASTDATISAVLQEAASRIMSISVVHEILDSNDRLSHVETGDLITRLLERIRHSFCPRHVSLEADVTSAVSHVDLALPLALLINELVTNAIKHAFTERDAGSVKIKLSATGTNFELCVSDNGIGMPTGANGKIEKPRIVSVLATQIGASVDCWVDNGTHWMLRFSEGKTVDGSRRPE